MSRYETGNTAIGGPNPTSEGAGCVGAPEPPQRLSRRAFARLGTMAGVGAAAATTVAVLGADASPAVAAVGRDVLLGKDNKGATGRTGIFATGGSPYATLADPSAGTGNGSLAAGVVGNGTVGVLGSGLGVDGAAIYATDSAINASAAEGAGECSGLKVVLSGPLNGNPAISAEHDGLGYAVLVNSTSPSYVAGPAAQFSSPVAHLRLMPGAVDHPSEGESGDLFVDAAGNLWFCKDPGTWVKRA